MRSHTHEGMLSVVGIGPGAPEHATPAALAAIAAAEVVVGYRTYIRLVADRLAGKEVIQTGMTEEIGRARAAVERAASGARVAVISSGDAGVYGMAALVLEVLHERGWHEGDTPRLEIIPGITAANACASLVGAPLGHDWCTISLSDLLTPWPVIERRLEAAAAADFVTVLYNPKSGRRTRGIVLAREILSRHRLPTTPVALVKSAYRRRQRVVLTDLEHMLEHEIGMLTTVIVGNSNTYRFGDLIVTPRGYAAKYHWDGSPRPGQRPAHPLRLEGCPE